MKDGMPQWFLNGVNAALLAPTAMNQQKFFFTLQPDGNVKVACGAARALSNPAVKTKKDQYTNVQHFLPG